jgi:hypothetical protein
MTNLVNYHYVGGVPHKTLQVRPVRSSYRFRTDPLKTTLVTS